MKLVSGRVLLRIFGVFLLGVFLVLRYTGFCFSRMQYVPDEDFYVALLSAQSRSDADIDLGSDRVILRNYVRENPDCCRIIENPPDKGWLSILLFDNYRRVIVRYPVKADVSLKFKYKYYWSISYMGSCCERGEKTGTFGDKEL